MKTEQLIKMVSITKNCPCNACKILRNMLRIRVTKKEYEEIVR